MKKVHNFFPQLTQSFKYSFTYSGYSPHTLTMRMLTLLAPNIYIPKSYTQKNDWKDIHTYTEMSKVKVLVSWEPGRFSPFKSVFFKFSIIGRILFKMVKNDFYYKSPVNKEFLMEFKNKNKCSHNSMTLIQLFSPLHFVCYGFPHPPCFTQLQ